jgi:hypothetical protein
MSTEPVLFDGVTLRHFGVAEALELCREFCDHRESPRWTDAVSREISEGVRLGLDECLSVQECAWLGAPVEPDVLDLGSIVRLQRALSGTVGVAGNAGEAESIYFAERLGGIFATDDGVAYDFACRRLGRDHVFDTIDILSDAVRGGIVTPHEAAELAGRVSDSGRHLRRGRPRYPGSTYFELT